MERKLQRFYDTFYYFVPYPYTISLLSGKRNLFISLKKDIHYYCWVLFVTLLILHSVQVAVTLMLNIQIYLKFQEVVKLTFHGIWAISFIIIISQQLSYVAVMNEVMQQGNGTFALNHNLAEGLKVPKLFEKDKYFRQHFLLACYYQTGPIALFCAFPVFLYFRGEVWHFGSNFYNFAKYILNLSDWMSAPFGIVAEFAFLSNTCAANILHLHVNCLYIQTFSTVVNYLTGLPNIWRKQLDLQVKMITHQKLRILTTIYNNSYGKYYIPAMSTTTGMVAICGLFMVIKLSHLNHFLVTVCGILSVFTCGCVLAIVTSLSGYVHTKSQKLSIHMRSVGCKGKLGRQILRSFKVDCVKSGDFYEIQKITSLTALGIVANAAGSVLLSVSF